MPRTSGRAAAQASAGAPGPAATLGDIRVQIDRTQMQIGDIMFFARMREVDVNNLSEAEQQDMLFRMLPIFERIVVGGVAHYPIDQIPQVVAAVTAAMNHAGN